jgi:chromate reductase
MTHDKIRLLGISGSIRTGSYNSAILNSVAAEIAPRVKMATCSLADLPLFTEDLDESPPLAVQNFRDLIHTADGVVISTPEYNYGISGVLKNALDWASRPYGKSALTGKPTLTLSASPASTGGVRAQAQLNETLICIGAQILIRPQIVISHAHSRIKDGQVFDQETMQFVLNGVEDLLLSITRHRALLRQGA